MVKHGPVDVIVLAAGEPQFNGSVFRELKKQTAAGIIRVLDALVLLKDREGKTQRINFRELSAEDADAVGFIGKETLGLFDSADENTFNDGMVPGSAIVALAIEHTWAVNLVNAMQSVGMEMAFNFRVPAPVVDEAFASLKKE